MNNSTPNAGSSSSLSDELQKLAALRAQGVLSAEEFQEAKKRLIGEVPPSLWPNVKAAAALPAAELDSSVLPEEEPLPPPRTLSSEDIEEDPPREVWRNPVQHLSPNKPPPKNRPFWPLFLLVCLS